MRPKRAQRDIVNELRQWLAKESAEGRFEILCELAVLLRDELYRLRNRRTVGELSVFGDNPKLYDKMNLGQHLAGIERRLIVSMLKKTGGHQARAAQRLGLKASTLHEKMKRYGIVKNQIVEDL